MRTEFEPKLVTVLREGYSRRQLLEDALAGLIVGIVALPLSIAFAVAAGARPEQGIVTAIFGGFLISALGGTRVQIGGPTGAFIVLIYGVLAEFGYEGLAIATMLAGLMLVAMGFARLGAVIRFVPYPVTVGFTTGIALVIATSQVVDALGLGLQGLPSEFLFKLPVLAAHLGESSAWAAGITVGTILVVRLWPRVSTRIPSPLVAIVLAGALVHLLQLPVDTIGTRFGAISSAIPLPRVPRVDLAVLPALVSPALAIALLAGIESLLSAVVADGMTGRRHRPNAELIAQGVANFTVPFFGGIPATGAIARTATNVKSGGRTPMAGIFHAATLLVILLVGGSWAALIPLPALAGILLVVAYNMSEWRLFARLLRGPRSDVLVLLTTFLLTVLVDLTVAIQVGVVLAALLFMRRMAEVTQVRAVTSAISEDESGESGGQTGGRPIPEGVEVFEIRGSFFFGSAQKFTEIIGQIERTPPVVILRMRDVFVLDATGMHALEAVWTGLLRQGSRLLLSGVHSQPLQTMVDSGLVDRIGEENLHATFDLALDRAEELLREMDRGAERRALREQ